MLRRHPSPCNLKACTSVQDLTGHSVESSNLAIVYVLSFGRAGSELPLQNRAVGVQVNDMVRICPGCMILLICCCMPNCNLKRAHLGGVNRNFYAQMPHRLTKPKTVIWYRLLHATMSSACIRGCPVGLAANTLTLINLIPYRCN